jgi:hypothetical protein
MVRWLAVVPGIILLVGTALSVLRSLVVPRANSSRALFVIGGRLVAPAFTFAARRRRTWVDQEHILAFAGPVALIALFGTWLAGFLLGFTLVLWPADHLTLLGAAREAGSSLFTLGIVSSSRVSVTLVDYGAAAVGLLVVALEIAYVPTLYAAFNRREVQVTLLQGRAGAPAWGPELLARHWYVEMVEALAPLYREWEVWCADLAESHTNYPILLFFRSPHPLRSWLLALLAVLDSAALYVSFSPEAAPVQARMVLRMGFESLREIAAALKIPFDPDPRPTDPIALTREEFHEGVARLVEVGFPMERSEEEAWPHFRAWRVNYESIAYVLARNLNAAPSRWSGERTGIGEVEPSRLVNRTPDAPDGQAGRFSGR